MARYDALTRRTMMKCGLAGLPLAATTSLESIESATLVDADDLAQVRNLVRLSGDGPSMTPPEYVDLLQQVIREHGIETDNYSRGGVVAAQEERMATLLGNERAVFLATVNETLARRPTSDVVAAITGVASRAVP